jgi:hypothetical protein
MKAVIIRVSKVIPRSEGLATTDIGEEQAMFNTEAFKEGDLALFIDGVSFLPDDILNQISNNDIIHEDKVLLSLNHPVFSRVLGFRYEGEDLSELFGVKKD